MSLSIISMFLFNCHDFSPFLIDCGSCWAGKKTQSKLIKDKIHVEGDRQLQWSSPYRFQIIVISINEVLDDESFCGFFSCYLIVLVVKVFVVNFLSSAHLKNVYLPINYTHKNLHSFTRINSHIISIAIMWLREFGMLKEESMKYWGSLQLLNNILIFFATNSANNRTIFCC